MDTSPLHSDLAPVAWLLGTWSGVGRGEYPTIDTFTYEETITFAHVGKPFLSYAQRTRHAVDGRALHSESGFWRFPRPGRVEVVLAHPTGIVEVLEGTIEPGLISLRSTTVAETNTAKSVAATERLFMFPTEAAPTSLSYRVAMAAVGLPLTHHLSASLERQTSG